MLRGPGDELPGSLRELLLVRVHVDGRWTEYGSLIGVPIERSVPVTTGG